jgi:hypothetical protein
MLTRQLPVLTLVMGVGLVLVGCGSSSPSNTGGLGGGALDGAAGGSGGGSAGTGGATGGAGGAATGGAGGAATGGAGGAATGGAGGAATGGAGGAAGGAGGAPNLGCGTAANSCTKAETDAHNNCLITKCESAYRPCIGDGWQSGNFGGLCGTWFKCYNACGCGNFSCAANCGLPPAECQTCLMNANNCQTSMCPQPACYGVQGDGGVTNPGSDGGAGGACADLQKCCDMITNAQLKAACSMQAATGVAAACGPLLTGYKGQGLCM